MELHPLCTLFPPASETDFKRLVEDIRLYGLRDPILKYEGKVIDGQNRLKACNTLGIQPTFLEYDGDDILQLVISKNLSRRHLSDSQKASVVAALTNYQNTYQQGGDRKSQNRKVVLKTVEDRSRIAGVSRETQRKADVVAKYDKSLIQKVSSGEVALNVAFEIATDKKQRDKRRLKTPQSKFIKTESEQQKKISVLMNQVSKLASENADLKRQIRYFLLNIGLITSRGWHKRI